MARVTHVKRARQRYKMVPTLDEHGQPVKVPVLRGDGQPKTNKHGRPVMQTQSTPDRSQPLPNRKCGRCGTEIVPGSPYKWIAPRSGPYGGRKLYRCGACPNWHVWEYSSSLSARIEQIQYQGMDCDADNEDDLRAHLESVAEQIRELAEEKRASAESIESGFGHATYQSDELNEQADALDGWADEVEQADIPEVPEECDGDHDRDLPDENCSCHISAPCENCIERSKDDCEVCQEYEAFDLDSWRDDALSAIDNSPL